MLLRLKDSLKDSFKDSLKDSFKDSFKEKQWLKINWLKTKEIALCYFFLARNSISWKSPKFVGVSVLTFLIAAGTGYYFATTTPAAAVMVNGLQVGLVQSALAGETLVNTVLEQQGQPFGLAAKTHDQITYKKLRLTPAAYQKSALNAETLAVSLSYYFDGCTISVDGDVFAVLPGREAADTVLKAYQDYYVKPSAQNQVTSVGFAETISIEDTEAAPEQIILAEEALRILLDGKITAKDYIVQNNDSWWLIARKNDMLTDEVLAGNPGNTKETVLRTGQVLKLVSSSPYLTVVSKGVYTGPVTIPFDIVTRLDGNLGAGQTKILTPGSNGSKIVTYAYEQRNGIQVAKQILDEEITQSPVDQVVARGTRPNQAVALSRGDGSTTSIVNQALSLRGSAYVFGGTGASGAFDCSGFTKAVFASNGISLPRTSYSQFASGTAVNKSDLLPGDLVFFSTYASGASHVGIYIGGGSFVHANTPSTGVITSSMGDSFYSSRYLGARRYD